MEAIEKIENKLVIGKKSRVAKVMSEEIEDSFDNQEISSPSANLAI
jgi:hypothetical protein